MADLTAVPLCEPQLSRYTTPPPDSSAAEYDAAKLQRLAGLACDEPVLTAARSSEPKTIQANDVTQTEQQDWLTNKRQVQKRYRDRQKERRREQETELQAVDGQLASLQAEIQQLTRHKHTLETAAAFNDQEIAKLQAKQLAHNVAAEAVQRPKSADAVDCKIPQPGRHSILQTYKGFVQIMTGLLLQETRDGTSAALTQQMESAAHAAVQLGWHAALFNIEDSVKLLSSRLDCEPDQQHPFTTKCYPSTQEHWQAITDTLELTPHQQQSLISLHKRFWQQLSSNRTACRSMCAILHQGMQDLRVLHSSGSKAAVQHPALVLALQDKISHLRSSLQEKNRIWFDFYATAFQTWGAKQVCRLSVHSFPKYPDVLAIACCVAIQTCGQGKLGSDQQAFVTHANVDLFV